MFQKGTLFLFLFFALCSWETHAQNNDNKTIDSIRVALKQTENQPQKAALLIKLSSYSKYIGSDKSINYASQGLSYAKKANDSEQISLAHTYIGIAYEIKSDYPHALKSFYNILVF